jgi:hypothetical protein
LPLTGIFAGLISSVFVAKVAASGEKIGAVPEKYANLPADFATRTPFCARADSTPLSVTDEQDSPNSSAITVCIPPN